MGIIEKQPGLAKSEVTVHVEHQLSSPTPLSSLKGYSQILSNNGRSLFPDQQRSGIGILIGKERTVSDLEIGHHAERVCDVRFPHWSGRWTSLVSPQSEKTGKYMLGTISCHLPATLRPPTPYTFRRASTTPPWSRGFMAHVPSYINTFINDIRPKKTCPMGS